MRGQSPKIVIITGPTCIGKTSAALALAEKFHGAIIGADSMQIYRHMDIGTAKPDAGERARAPHFMIDIADPDESYDAARYAREARQAVLQTGQQGRVPLVVGGTGFYIKALVHGLFEAAPADPELREKLKEEARDHGLEVLYARLQLHDPESAARIHPHDTYRVIRALEMFDLTGTPMSRYQQAHAFADRFYETIKFCLYMDREALYDQINARVESMIEGGLLAEVKALLARGYGQDLRPMQAIGYRQMLDFLEGRFDWEAAVAEMKKATRRYAKRQLTWFRKDPEMIWKKPGEIDAIIDEVQAFLEK